MQVRDGRYECALCGAVLDVPASNDPPQTAIHSATSKATVRVLTVNNVEVHRCELGGDPNAGRPDKPPRFPRSV